MLDDTEKMDIMFFVSCIAFLMKGFYVGYTKLCNIKLPTSQTKLQQLNILAHSRLTMIAKMPVFRLKEDIDLITLLPKPVTSKSASSAQVNAQLNVDIPSIEAEDLTECPP